MHEVTFNYGHYQEYKAKEIQGLLYKELSLDQFTVMNSLIQKQGGATWIMPW